MVSVKAQVSEKRSVQELFRSLVLLLASEMASRKERSKGWMWELQKEQWWEAGWAKKSADDWELQKGL